jgi:hypothetical protein
MMITNRIMIKLNGFDITGILIEPKDSLGTVIIVHGYGGSKEEQLGLGWRIAECGFSSFMIDLPGHGENKATFEGNIKLYVDSAIEFFKINGKVISIGHSVGGRISLTSRADYVIGISPTLVKEFSNETMCFINNFRSYRVRQHDDEFLWLLHKQLPLFDITNDEKAMVIYGSRDVPEIVASCRQLKGKIKNISEIEKAMHNDIYLDEKVFKIIIDQLKLWI